ncbi:MAG: hypothetical protein M1820_007897 [Bogoriella megaspora]|nr:MAG: hypothetical protein M1820_007897 [Bogoriella megaspora]
MPILEFYGSQLPQSQDVLLQDLLFLKMRPPGNVVGRIFDAILPLHKHQPVSSTNHSSLETALHASVEVPSDEYQTLAPIEEVAIVVSGSSGFPPKSQLQNLNCRNDLILQSGGSQDQEELPTVGDDNDDNDDDMASSSSSDRFRPQTRQDLVDVVKRNTLRRGTRSQSLPRRPGPPPDKPLPEIPQLPAHALSTSASLSALRDQLRSPSPSLSSYSTDEIPDDVAKPEALRISTPPVRSPERHQVKMKAVDLIHPPVVSTAADPFAPIDARSIRSRHTSSFSRDPDKPDPAANMPPKTMWDGKLPSTVNEPRRAIQRRSSEDNIGSARSKAGQYASEVLNMQYMNPRTFKEELLVVHPDLIRECDRIWYEEQRKWVPLESWEAVAQLRSAKSRINQDGKRATGRMESRPDEKLICVDTGRIQGVIKPHYPPTRGDYSEVSSKIYSPSQASFNLSEPKESSTTPEGSPPSSLLRPPSKGSMNQKKLSMVREEPWSVGLAESSCHKEQRPDPVTRTNDIAQKQVPSPKEFSIYPRIDEERHQADQRRKQRQNVTVPHAPALETAARANRRAKAQVCREASPPPRSFTNREKTPDEPEFPNQHRNQISRAKSSQHAAARQGVVSPNPFSVLQDEGDKKKKHAPKLKKKKSGKDMTTVQRRNFEMHGIETLKNILDVPPSPDAESPKSSFFSPKTPSSKHTLRTSNSSRTLNTSFSTERSPESNPSMAPKPRMKNFSLLERPGSARRPSSPTPLSRNLQHKTVAGSSMSKDNTVAGSLPFSTTQELDAGKAPVEPRSSQASKEEEPNKEPRWKSWGRKMLRPFGLDGSFDEEGLDVLPEEQSDDEKVEKNVDSDGASSSGSGNDAFDDSKSQVSVGSVKDSLGGDKQTSENSEEIEATNSSSPGSAENNRFFTACDSSPIGNDFENTVEPWSEASRDLNIRALTNEDQYSLFGTESESSRSFIGTKSPETDDGSSIDDESASCSSENVEMEQSPLRDGEVALQSHEIPQEVSELSAVKKEGVSTELRHNTLYTVPEAPEISEEAGNQQNTVPPAVAKAETVDSSYMVDWDSVIKNQVSSELRKGFLRCRSVSACEEKYVLTFSGPRFRGDAKKNSVGDYEVDWDTLRGNRLATSLSKGEFQVNKLGESETVVVSATLQPPGVSQVDEQVNRSVQQREEPEACKSSASSQDIGTRDSRKRNNTKIEGAGRSIQRSTSETATVYLDEDVVQALVRDSLERSQKPTSEGSWPGDKPWTGLSFFSPLDGSPCPSTQEEYDILTPPPSSAIEAGKEAEQEAEDASQTTATHSGTSSDTEMADAIPPLSDTKDIADDADKLRLPGSPAWKLNPSAAQFKPLGKRLRAESSPDGNEHPPSKKPPVFGLDGACDGNMETAAPTSAFVQDDVDQQTTAHALTSPRHCHSQDEHSGGFRGFAWNTTSAGPYEMQPMQSSDPFDELNQAYGQEVPAGYSGNLTPAHFGFPPAPAPTYCSPNNSTGGVSPLQLDSSPKLARSLGSPSSSTGGFSPISPAFTQASVPHHDQGHREMQQSIRGGFQGFQRKRPNPFAQSLMKETPMINNRNAASKLQRTDIPPAGRSGTPTIGKYISDLSRFGGDAHSELSRPLLAENMSPTEKKYDLFEGAESEMLSSKRHMSGQSPFYEPSSTFSQEKSIGKKPCEHMVIIDAMEYGSGICNKCHEGQH